MIPAVKSSGMFNSFLIPQRLIALIIEGFIYYPYREQGLYLNAITSLDNTFLHSVQSIPAYAFHFFKYFYSLIQPQNKICMGRPFRYQSLNL